MIFSAVDLWDLGRAAERPYYPAGTDVINRLQPWGLYDIDDGNDYGYIARWDNCWSIHVLGSDDARDWCENIFGWIRKDSDTGAVIGYSRPGARIAMQAMRIIGDSGLPVLLEGHSRGGAIVQDVALRMARAGAVINRVVTFGSPPVGGSRFWDKMADARLLVDRYVINGDIVPNTPPWGKQYGKPIRCESDARGIKGKHLDYGNCVTGEYEI